MVIIILTGKPYRMKKLSLKAVVGFLFLHFFISCNYFDDNHNTSFRYQETSDYFSMKAHFDKRKTRDVEEYMDRKIGRRSNMSFVNSRIDGKIALSDQTIFYIKKYPGTLEIKLDKDENSSGSYYEIKDMCEGLKQVVVK